MPRTVFGVSYSEALMGGATKGHKKGVGPAKQCKGGKNPDDEGAGAEAEEKEIEQLEVWVEFAVLKFGDGPLLDAVRRDNASKTEAIASAAGGSQGREGFSNELGRPLQRPLKKLQVADAVGLQCRQARRGH